MGSNKSLEYKSLVGISCLVLGQIWGATPAHAREDVVPGSRYTSARGAAMGDAFLPLGEDGASGLFYNPAVLGKARNSQGIHADIFNLSFYGNGGLISNFDMNFYKVTSLSSYLSTLQANPGSFIGGGMSFAPTFYAKGFAFGALLQSQVGAKSNGDGTVTYKSMYQFIPTLGTGIRLASGIVRLGYSLQWVQQGSGTITVPDTTTPLGYNQGLAKGSALSHNLGFALTLPVAYLPSFNLVARNVLGATFTSFAILPFTANSNGVPDNEPTTFDTSFSVQSKLGRGSYFNWVAEVRDFTNRSHVSALARAALGMEFSFKEQVYLRGGYGSGYPTAGLGLKSGKGEFSATWGSEEIGGGYHSLRDTHFIIQYQAKTLR